MVIAHCTLSRNEAGLSGGGITADFRSEEEEPNVLVLNSILWNNFAPGQYIELAQVAFSVPPPGGPVSVLYTCLQGLDLFGDPEYHNIGDDLQADDPDFITPLTGTWTAAPVFEPAGYPDRTRLTDANAAWTPGALVGCVVACTEEWECDGRPLTVIAANTATELYVWGDFSELWPSGYDYAIYDYRLTSVSPCLDTASRTYLPEDLGDLDEDSDTEEDTPLDLELLPRMVGAADILGLAKCDVTDMGAFEYQVGCSWCERGDLNYDGLFNGADIQRFVECCLAEPVAECYCYCADLDSSGTIDGGDVQCFVLVMLGDLGCMHDCWTDAGGGPRQSGDCNGNEVPDWQDIANATSSDCNHNFIPDECDVDAGDPDGNGLVSDDDNANGIPDECEADCNGNGIPDDMDIAGETADDVNGNGIPDECEPDCNANTIPDAWDIAQSTSADCNQNGTPDECEPDCNENGVPDDCDIDPSDPDGDEWVSPDCNESGSPDECDIALGPPFGSLDCNENGIPDECDLADCEGDPWCDDCNANGFLDECDIAAEISLDANENGIPDECEGEGLLGGGEQMMGGEGFGGGYLDGLLDGPCAGLTPEEWYDDPACAAAWGEFFDWSMQQTWGPASVLTGTEQLQRMLAKLAELGLPNPWQP